MWGWEPEQRKRLEAMELIQGNEACARGALYAGCNFFAGYPITPASEIMEWMARELPRRRGTFIQMEDELASIAAVIGASWSGAKAMTATSGPGFSLMQENLGYAAMTETPCVVVDSQRGGPSTGLPTLPSQGDVMQARWGTNGDRPAIVLTASSVLSAYELTISAFNFTNAYRIPVVLLLDAAISHLRENVDLPRPPVVERKTHSPVDDEHWFGEESFSPFGEGKVKVVTGLAHRADGIPASSDGATLDRMLRGLFARIERHLDEILLFDEYRTEGARWLILSYGITSRASRAAVDMLRAEHRDAGMLDLKTLWPLPEKMIVDLAERVDGILVPELNLGQLVMPIRAAVAGRVPVVSLGRADGKLFRPAELVQGVHTLERRAMLPPDDFLVAK